MRVAVEPPVFTLFPDLRLAVVVASGCDNRTPRPDLAERLLEEARSVGQAFSAADVATHSAISPWRQAYAAFGARPGRFRSSIESLVRGAAAGRLRSISPLVDLYNAVSLRHLLPCGGEDRARVSGDLRLVRAAGGESFVPLGGAGEEPAFAGEVIYRDDMGAICRCLNWREADRTKLTESSREVVLVVEALGDGAAERAAEAGRELAAGIRDVLGGSTALFAIGPSAPLAEFGHGRRPASSLSAGTD